MFETLFTYPRVLRRHREGPLAEERAAYLCELAARCVAPATLIKQARCCLRVAVELERWPGDRCFDNAEVREMASRYAARSRVASSRNAREHFRATAVDLLRRLGRLRPVPTGLPHRYEAMLCEFVALQHDRSWLSEATCQSARWQITKFLDYPRAAGFGPGDDPSRRCRCVLSAHGVAVEPPFAEPFRQLLARVVGVLREAGLRTARSRKGSPRTTHLPPRDAADGSNLANRREHARGDQRRRPDIDQRPRDHPAVVGLRSPLRRGSPAAPRRYRLAERPDPFCPIQERPARRCTPGGPGR